MRALKTLVIAGLMFALTGVVTQAHAVTIDFKWDWHITIQPVPDSPVGPDPIELWLWGPAQIEFTQLPFDPGTQANPLPVPPTTMPFGPIQTEILSMDLTGSDPRLGNVRLTEGAAGQSLGQILDLENNGGILTANSFFDVFIELEFDQPSPMTILNEQAFRIGMNFTPGDGIPDDDFLWLPVINWTEFTVNTPELVDQFGVPWDTVITVHTELTKMPEPGTLALFGAGLLGIGVWRRRRTAQI